jgi:nucleotide-binding universal stress UspA family protein
MLKDILVCLEGSPSSEAATGIAIELGRTFEARLAGLAIIDEPDIRAGAMTGIGGASYKHERDEVLLADAHKQADDWVALFDRRCREGGVTDARSLEVVGRPAESILAHMKSHDLTIMGKDANFRFETEGDDVQTREAILHRASSPLLLVPETAVSIVGKVTLLAYDGSGAAKRALASFAASGLGARADVHVATADDSGVVAREMAERGVALLREAGIAARAHNIVSTLPSAEALFELAHHLGAGLMVMGAFAHSRIKHLFHASVTRGLVEQASIPLYLQH